MRRATALIAALSSLSAGIVLGTSAAHADNVSPVRVRKPVASFNDGDKPQKLSIRGVCTLLEGSPNPIATPCSNVLLKLAVRSDVKPATPRATPRAKAESGNEIEARTDSNGRFAFAVDPGKTYSLLPGSRSHVLVSPSGPFKGGDPVIDVKLKMTD